MLFFVVIKFVNFKYIIVCLKNLKLNLKIYIKVINNY